MRGGPVCVGSFATTRSVVPRSSGVCTAAMACPLAARVSGGWTAAGQCVRSLARLGAYRTDCYRRRCPRSAALVGPRHTRCGVGATRGTACGDAAAPWTATGRPARSTMARTVVPLTHVVVPTQSPLCLPRRKSRRCSTRRDPAPRAPAGQMPGPGGGARRRQSGPRMEIGDDRFARADSAGAHLAMAHRSATSRPSP